MDEPTYKVLIVDDDPCALRIQAAILEQAGYVVEQATDGLQALTAMEQNGPDFLITDWEMPLLNGLELCRTIRSKPNAKYIYIIFITGRSSSDNQIEGMESGADDYLSKPVQREVLLARLRAGERILKLERQLNALASTDPLTSLLSKRAFQPFLEKEWRRARRYQLPLSCVMLDADFFKRVNDTYGHPAGDEVLKAIAGVLREDCRASDILCRYGGEEFVALLPETDEESATLWAERVRAQVAELRFQFGKRAISVTCSFGIAQRTIDIHDENELVALADQALNVAKQSGRDRVVSYSAMESTVQANDGAREHGYRKLFESTSAANVMTTFLASLRENDTVEQAARHFLRSRTSSAPVVNDQGKLSGIVSEKDLLVLMRTPKDWLRPLRDIMKRNVICYELETPLITIYEFLCRVAIRQVLIVDQGRPLGMINQMNLVRWFNNWFETNGQLPQRQLLLEDDLVRTELCIAEAMEQLHEESGRLLEQMQAEDTELIPLLIDGASRVQEKLNDLLSLSRHANELDPDCRLHPQAGLCAAGNAEMAAETDFRG